jgi:cell division control protein 24
MSPSSAVKLRVNYGDFTFVIVVLSTITYFELVEKVVRKIHLCGARSGVDTTTLRLRYEDEEHDKILISADEDVMMAFDWLRSGNAGPANALVLFAD